MSRKKLRTYRLKPRVIYNEPRRQPMDPETKKGIAVVILLVVAALSILAIFNLAGGLGDYLKQGLQFTFGFGFYLFPVILGGLALVLLKPDKYQLKPSNYVGLFFFVASLGGLFRLINGYGASESLGIEKSGGLIGYALSNPLEKIASFGGALLILIAILIISLMLSFNASLNGLLQKMNIFAWFKNKFSRAENYEEPTEEDLTEEGPQETEVEEPTEEEKELAAEQAASEATEEKSFLTTKKLSSPSRDQSQKIKEVPDGFNVTYSSNKMKKVEVPLDLLDNKTSKPTSGDIKANMEKIHKTLKNFGIDVEMGGINVGPTITQFTLKPAEGVKLSQIVALQNDLALALAAHPLRIEAPIPGKSLVGIEVPNQSIALVRLREIIASEDFKKKRGQLIVSLGKDVGGNIWARDLSGMPHLLIAGATGSGKSVCINNLIVSLLYQHSPDNLRLILVDPKRVELTSYNGIPHLLTPVITEVDKTINALRWVVNEMDQRYKLFSALSRRNIEAYNSSVITNKLPYIVVIVDELADLMASAARDVESAIVRLAQMARATGIHLVVATQRPSVDVITGLIKANITSRIAFAVASQVDSRTIIDTSGADKLLGKGDMLFIAADVPKARRLQCAYVSDEEIENVVNFWKNEGEPEYQEAIVEKPSKGGLPGFAQSGDDDELLEEAKDVIIKAGKGSASLLQRRLRVGYARAARLLDLLEEQGIIGPVDGAKPRELLVSADDLAIATETTERYTSHSIDELNHADNEAEETEENNFDEQEKISDDLELEDDDGKKENQKYNA